MAGAARDIAATNVQPRGFFSLYQLEPQVRYRAGCAVAQAPSESLSGLSYELFQGGAYVKFVLTGPYEQLPEACGRVFDRVKELKIQPRAGFYIENYVNDPRTTAPGELVTEILVPV